jgi:hypothetical protein
MRITDYLGKHVSSLLKEEPFKNWPFDKSVEDDLEERITNYVFKEHGFELSCDQNDKIRTFFLYSDKFNGIDEGFFEIPLSWKRGQVLEHFGVPSKSGGPLDDPILGKYGEWHRFDLPDYAVHIEYYLDSEKIKRITLMRSDVVPN